MNTNLTPFVTITGDLKIDRAIGKWIKGTEDYYTVSCMILDAQWSHTLPTFDDQGRAWSVSMILDYALMVTPRN